LGLAFYFGAVLLFEVVFLFAALIVGLIAYAAGLALHALGVPWVFLAALGVALGILLYLLFFAYCMVMVIGSVLTFLEAYALYFLGGRYPMLGDLLERSTPTMAVYMPPAGGPPYNPPGYSPGYSPGYPPPGYPPPPNAI
jgi:hypothetical protein